MFQIFFLTYNIIVIEDRSICDKSGSKEQDKSMPEFAAKTLFDSSITTLFSS
jgi:hypothetical protein